MLDLLVIAAACSTATIAAALSVPERDESDAYFRKGAICLIELDVPQESADSLRKDPRTYVRCRVLVDGKCVSESAGVKIKGSAGSFQSYDERPAFTIDLDRFGEAPRWNGLEKFHLNNSVQDPSLLSEWTAAEILRDADYPHARVGHAQVLVSSRDMGVYVLKESFDEHWLARNFKDPNGNLYDGGFCQDIAADLELDEARKAEGVAGQAAQPLADLRALSRAASGADLKARWEAIPSVLDVQKFARFMALEMMLGHWDGYSLNTNNYRLFFDAKGKAIFLLHGMDQTFQDPEASVLDMPRGMLASSVMKNPAWRKEYRKQVSTLLPSFGAKRLLPKLESLQKRLQPVLKRVSAAAAEEQAARAREFVERLAARERSLKAQAVAPEPKPIDFKPGRERTIQRWNAFSEVEDAEVEVAKGRDGSWYRIAAGPSGRCIAGFRTSLLLPKGRFRLEAVAKTGGVVKLDDPDSPTAGAGIRAAGQPCAKPLEGSQDARIEYEFEVTEEMADIELVLELRAKAGEAVFKADSVKLTLLAPKRER